MESGDYFSELPDEMLLHIISFLPNKFTARMALLSRRWLCLWQAAPFLNFDTCSVERGGAVMHPSRMMDRAHETLVQWNPLSPLLCLRLCFRPCPGQGFNFGSLNSDIINYSDTDIKTVSSLLDKAGDLGVRHLSVKLILDTKIWLNILPRILSLCTLESLSLKNVLLKELSPFTSINLKHLRSLCISFHDNFKFPTDFINWIIPQLHVLDDLHIRSRQLPDFLHLKSNSVRILKLDLNAYKLRISAPSLEHFELKSKLVSSLDWDWAMPMLSKAVIQLQGVSQENVKAIFNMLYAVANVQELHIDVMESQNQKGNFHALLLPGVDPPTFFDLKHFKLELRFHEDNIEDLVTLLQHSPALESLKLVHKPPFRAIKNGMKMLRRSRRLPQNTEGNYRHVYCEDLHILGRREELLGQIIEIQSSKRLKTHGGISHPSSSV